MISSYPHRDVEQNSELAAYESSRVSVDGPKVFLEPKLALSMALVLHELATNASKYGAFARTRGKVLIKWDVIDSRLYLQWRESRGPVVVWPDHQGFGSRLVTGILASFGGKINAHFEPTGLVCDLSIGRRTTASTGRSAYQAFPRDQRRS
jgi:two-component sensor histidine kinase